MSKLKRLISNYFHQDSLAPATVELAVEDLFPGAEVEFAFGDGNDDFPPHDLSFQVRVGVVFTGAVVPVLVCRFVRRELLQPHLITVQQTFLGIVDEDRGGDVHRVDETKAFRHAAPLNKFLDLWRDVDESTPSRDFEPKMFCERFHSTRSVTYFVGDIR